MHKTPMVVDDYTRVSLNECLLHVCPLSDQLPRAVQAGMYLAGSPCTSAVLREIDVGFEYLFGRRTVHCMVVNKTEPTGGPTRSGHPHIPEG